LAYTMVAERGDQKVTKERTSALILLANARVWTSEGWQVVITDADGKQLDPASFENWLTPVESSPLQPENSASLEEHDLSAREQDLSTGTERPADEAEQAIEDSDESYESLEEAYESLDASEYPFSDQEFSEASGSLT
jgi:hypothetical protein